ncbi:MAG TPA: hypothetical protein VLC09_14375 [Polyangiaceae bacterium]|nr:hypothetical protein [Polyangiaceae bacterium]
MTCRISPLTHFPPEPQGLVGRELELRTLTTALTESRPARLALVGSGGSGKSMLAAALGHRVRESFEDRVHWFRVGGWDYYTLTELLALGLGLPNGEGRMERIREHLSEQEQLIVLDNHEEDRAMARLLDALGDTRATFVLTARRCLLSGVFIYPVVAPLVSTRQAAFPRVARLTQLLRYNPLALDLADALVSSSAIDAKALETWLRGQGVGRVAAIEHEDDLPEVARLVEWCWERLAPTSRRLLSVLAYSDGDHVDRRSLLSLGDAPARALVRLRDWRLVQEPLPDRFAVHAVVRHALRRLDRFPLGRAFEHYVDMIERHPERFVAEHSHLFAALDYAHRQSDREAILRVQRLLAQVEG